jgi:hypothetical protein
MTNLDKFIAEARKRNKDSSWSDDKMVALHLTVIPDLTKALEMLVVMRGALLHYQFVDDELAGFVAGFSKTETTVDESSMARLTLARVEQIAGGEQ